MTAARSPMAVPFHVDFCPRCQQPVRVLHSEGALWCDHCGFVLAWAHGPGSGQAALLGSALLFAAATLALIFTLSGVAP